MSPPWNLLFYLDNLRCTADSTQGRDHSYALIADAIKQATKDAFVAKQEPLPQEQQAQEKGPSTRIHDIPSGDASSVSNKADGTVESQFRAAAISMFKSPEAAFNKLAGDTNSAGISSKRFLKALKVLGLAEMPKESRRALRKIISGSSKLITREAWLAFMGDGKDEKNNDNATGHSKKLALAVLPVEVPECKCRFVQARLDVYSWCAHYSTTDLQKPPARAAESGKRTSQWRPKQPIKYVCHSAKEQSVVSRNVRSSLYAP